MPGYEASYRRPLAPNSFLDVPVFHKSYDHPFSSRFEDAVVSAIETPTPSRLLTTLPIADGLKVRTFVGSTFPDMCCVSCLVC